MPLDSPLRLSRLEPADRWLLLTWLLVSSWIFACAWLVNGEYGDGYQTIINGRYFFGDSPDHFVQRGPLAALALWPVEFVVNVWRLNPVDVRPYHFYSGALHSFYLLGCWYLLKRSGQTGVAAIIAFVAAILSVVFYANAPYLSHDILPGLLFLIFIFVCNRWLNEPGARVSLILVLLGAAVVLIKQTYAIFWIVLLGYAVVSLLLKWDDGRVTARKFGALLLLAAASGLISWLAYGLFVSSELPHVPLLLRPYVLITSISSQFDIELSTLFAPDIYLRNAHNYGIAALLLVMPGVVFALRGADARLRMIAFCWLASLVIMQLVSFREVRYLAFLAPLTALLIAPMIRELLNRRLLVIGLAVIVAADQTRGVSLAAAQLSSTAQMNVTRFMNAPGSEGRAVVSTAFSFVYMADSPLRRDPYHGIYHLVRDHFRGLYEDTVEIVPLTDARDLGQVGIRPGDRVYYSNNTVLRKSPWRDDNVPTGLSEFLMVSGKATEIRLDREQDNYVIHRGDGGYVMLIPGHDAGQQMPLIVSSSLPAEQAQSLYGDIQGQDTISVIGVVVAALCQADQCIYR